MPGGYQILLTLNHAVDIIRIVVIGRERDYILIVLDAFDILEVALLAVFGVFVGTHELLEIMLLRFNAVLCIDLQLLMLDQAEHTSEARNHAAKEICHGSSLRCFTFLSVCPKFVDKEIQRCRDAEINNGSDILRELAGTYLEARLSECRARRLHALGQPRNIEPELQQQTGEQQAGEKIRGEHLKQYPPPHSLLLGAVLLKDEPAVEQERADNAQHEAHGVGDDVVNSKPDEQRIAEVIDEGVQVAYSEEFKELLCAVALVIHYLASPLSNMNAEIGKNACDAVFYVEIISDIILAVVAAGGVLDLDVVKLLHYLEAVLGAESLAPLALYLLDGVVVDINSEVGIAAGGVDYEPVGRP